MIRRVRATSGSTAAVLWLMILLVFLPIAAAHVVARATEPPDGSAMAPAGQVLPSLRALPSAG